MANPFGVLPEDKVFVDDGCSLAPSCLDCPLPVCRYDIMLDRTGICQYFGSLFSATLAPE